jgi:hypothetical protein
MRTSRGAGEDRSGGERWMIERHGRRNLRRRQFAFPYAGSGLVAIGAAEAPHHDRGISRAMRADNARTEPVRRKNGGEGAGGFDQSGSRH